MTKTTSLIQFVSLLWLVLSEPLVAICQTVMYFNLRVEKEGFNADVLWKEFGHRYDDSAASLGTNGEGRSYATVVTEEDDDVEEGKTTLTALA